MGELDINVGKLKKNAFRVSKVRGETAGEIRKWIDRHHKPSGY